MAKLKGQLETDNGDILYPHTSSEVVFGADGRPISEQIQNCLEQVNILNTGRGYLNTKLLDLNEAVKNGKYYSTGGLNQPMERGTYLVDVVTESNGATVAQIAICTYSEVGDAIGSTWVRVRQWGTWDKWRKKATTDKIDILVTPYIGYQLLENRSYKINNVVYLEFEVAMSNGSNIPNSTQCVEIASISSTLKPLTMVSSLKATALTNPNGNVLAPAPTYAMFTTGKIWGVNTAIGVKTLHITGEYTI